MMNVEYRDQTSIDSFSPFPKSATVFIHSGVRRPWNYLILDEASKIVPRTSQPFQDLSVVIAENKRQSVILDTWIEQTSHDEGMMGAVPVTDRVSFTYGGIKLLLWFQKPRLDILKFLHKIEDILRKTILNQYLIFR